MNTADRVMTVLARANPMPETEEVGITTDPNTYLATLQTRSSEVTQLDTKKETTKPPRNGR